MSCFNIHFSLLPEYRGAAPVQWALINGEKETGVSSFWLEKTLDSGPILVQQRIQIDDSDDEVTLFQKLIPLGLRVMNETMELLKNGRVPGNKQEGKATNAPILKKEDGKINWARTAEEIRNMIRGTKLWPGAYCIGAEGKLENKRIKILKAEIYDSNAPMKPGEISEIVKNNGFVVNCGKGALIITEVQPENKNPMAAWSFLQGGYASVGSKFL
jgi:methionyl-tRNA formyltransferase